MSASSKNIEKMASLETERMMADELPPQSPVTEHQKELATQSMQEFDRGQWNQCTNTMGKLADERPTDVKVVLNRSVALFYQGGCKAIDDLKYHILTVFNMARISPDLSENDNLDDADYAVVYYNKAVVLYHEKQYKAALNILERLFCYIEPIDEALAQKVMLLLTELYLTVHKPNDAMMMILNVEKFLIGKSQGSQDKEKQDTNNGVSHEALRSKLNLYKVRCNLMAKLSKNKKEYKSLQGNSPPVNYTKAYYEFLRGNIKKAAKILGNPPSCQLSPTTGECVAVMYYNNQAIINMCLRKPNLSICQIREALQCNDRVVREAVPNEKAKPSLPLSSVSQHYILMYNLGILQLHSKRPSAAFDCFVECVQVYFRNPRLWHRLAECCIMAYREDNDVDRQNEHKLEVVRMSIGSGFHHKLVLGEGVIPNKKTPFGNAFPKLSLGYAAFCLKNAKALLQPDPLDIKAPPPDSIDQIETGPRPNDPVMVSGEPGNPLKESDIASLRCSILAASAYVALCENEHYKALAHANDLLRQPSLSPAQRYLGRMYKGEALVALDKIADAVDELNPERVTDISTTIPESKTDQESKDKDQDPIVENRESIVKWLPSSLEVAKAFMQYNLAVAYANRTEFDRAMKALTESSENVGTPLPVHMYYLKIYLDLKQGNKKAAFDVINDNFGFISRT